MKIFSTKQIAEIDKYTIEHEPVPDIDLMERASLQITNWLLINISKGSSLKVFAGPGNNGGDALAVARLMAGHDYSVKVYLLDFGKDLKGSLSINWNRLIDQGKVALAKIGSESNIPQLLLEDVIIDGLFGSGLTSPLDGLPAKIVDAINSSNAKVIAIDIPSGLMGEDNSGNTRGNIVHATNTLSLQFPKISFFFPENENYVGNWEVLPIGLHPEGIYKTKSDYYFLSKDEVQSFIQSRSRFDHKGIMGHALLIAGSYGKMGAAILASRGCLRAGVGLLTTHIPRLGYAIIQTAVPEAMASIDQSDLIFTDLPDIHDYSAIGVGPGIGTKQNTQRAMFQLVEQSTKPLVIDADALNILADHPEWLEELPEKSILTPHPGEFKRLVGEFQNSYERLKAQILFARKFKVIIILKGAFTTIVLPSGNVFFNPTGNPGMATAGSGDVLTGIILGLLAQGLSPEHSSLAGVYIHGLAGDLAIQSKSEQGLIASDIIEYLGNAFLQLNSGLEK